MTRDLTDRETRRWPRALAVALACTVAFGCSAEPVPAGDAGEDAADDVPEKDYGPLPVDARVERPTRRDAAQEAPPEDVLDELAEERDVPEASDLPARSDAAPDTSTPPPAGSSCATARLLSSGESIELPTDRFTPAYDACVPLSSFRAGFAAVDVPAGQQLVVWPRPRTMASIYASCSARDCLRRARLISVEDRPGSLARAGVAVWTNDTGAPARVIVVLRVYDDSPSVPTVGATVRVAPVEPTQRCQTAPPLAVGDTVRGVTLATADASPGPCTLPSDPSRWWRVVVPAGHRALVQARRATPDLTRDLVVAFAERCGTTCCANATLAGFSGADVTYAAWTNTAAEAREVYVTLSGTYAPVDLTVTTAPPAPNVTCAARAPLRPGVDVTAQPFADALDGALTCDTRRRVSSALHYGVVVPARTRLTLRTTSGEAPHAVAIRSACGSTSSLAAEYSTETPAVTTARWANPFTTPTEVFVAVGRLSGVDLSGAFTLSASLDAVPAHAFCATPVTLTPGVPRSDQTGDATEIATGCGYARYRSLFYQITVPPGQLVAARSVEGYAALTFLDQCEASTCLGALDYDRGATYWRNTATVSRTVLLAAGNLFDDRNERFTVVASFEPTAAGARCDMAPRVTAPAALTDQSLVGLAGVPLACGVARASLFYRVRVQAGRRLTVTATPRGSPPTPVSLSVFAGCDSATCLAAPTGATVTWANDAAVERVVLVAATPDATPSPGAAVDLRFELAATP